ncbi:MAG: Gx transporter family protein [Lachnospiraceae bacterium]|nr:Gx transporter family protein [Lachnospiraceae bacterium]
MKLKKLTVLSMFTTLALIIFTVESAIPPLVPIPGIKLGLANIVTLVILHNYSAKDALLVLLMRILLSSFFFGQAMSLLYSLAGGLLCLVAMVLVHRLLQGHILYLISMVGAIFHNLGQLTVAYFITSVPGVLVYLPFLLISGILTGLFTGLCAHFIQKYLWPLTDGSRFFPKSGDDNWE